MVGGTLRVYRCNRSVRVLVTLVFPAIHLAWDYSLEALLAVGGRS